MNRRHCRDRARKQQRSWLTFVYVHPATSPMSYGNFRQRLGALILGSRHDTAAGAAGGQVSP
jgi:hypothetical protein